MENIKPIIEDMDSRINNLKIYLPFFNIYLANNNKYPYDLPIISLCVLSYFVHEGKLKHKKINFSNIQDYISKVLVELYNKRLDTDTLKDFTAYVLDKLQNNGNFVLKYYSIVDKREKEKIVKIIDMKQEKSDIYYYITDDGLDFYLKTKEFPEESKITINLLLFQKQIENGSYEHAFDTVRNLRVEVEKRIEEKRSVVEKLMFGGKEGIENYNKYHEKVNSQFRKEESLFQEVLLILDKDHEEFIDKVEKNVLTEKEKKAHEQLKLISNEMKISMDKHDTLLKEVVDIIDKYNEIIKIKQKNAFSEKFKFNQELEKIAQKNISIAKTQAMIEPLLNPKTHKSFNPLYFFKPQTIMSKRNNDSFEEIDTEAPEKEKPSVNKEVEKRVSCNLKFLLKTLLEAIEEKGELFLMDWVENVKNNYNEGILYNADLISFLIKINDSKKSGEKIKVYDIEVINNTSPNEPIGEIESYIKELTRDNPSLITYKKISITPISSEDISINEVIKVTNMCFKGVD